MRNSACGPIKYLSSLSIILLSQTNAAFAQVMTPNDIDAAAPAMTNNRALIRQNGAAASDSDNAIEVGDYARAEAVATDRLKTAIGGVNEIALRLSLIEALMWQGKFQTLSQEMNRVNQLIKKNNVDSSLLARAYDVQSWCLQIQGNTSKAEDWARDSLSERRKTPQDAVPLCGALEHLSNLLVDRGAYEEALALSKEALDVRVKSLGVDSVAAANEMERLAALYYKQGDEKDARPLFTKSLEIKEKTHAAFKPFAPQRADDAVFYRFIPGAANVSRETSNGVTRERITANNLIVEAALLLKSDSQMKNSKVEIRITNNSSWDARILPQGADLIVLKPRIRLATQVQGESLAQTIEKKGESKAKWIRFWGNQATATSTTNIIGSGGGYMPYGMGYMPQNFGYGGPNGWGGNNWGRNNSGMTTMMTSVPDFEARARAMQRAQAITDQTQQKASNIRESELGPSTLAPGQSVEGCLFFDDNKFDEAILRIPIGKAVFEFRFEHLR
ncbi:MAG: tetratricopeptide repeat protein [Leptolyngbya sp.]|nr:tetratricopeptide repeat protein [Candidatus Melainabacteria bacterium]